MHNKIDFELKTIADLEKVLQQNKKNRVLSLAVAADEAALQAVSKAVGAGYLQAVLVGNVPKIREIATAHNISLHNCILVHEPKPALAVQQAVQLVREQKAHILMKGAVSTASFLMGVLNTKWGLHEHGKLLSHIALFELENYHKLLALTDVAMNIAPDLSAKVHIVKNAVAFLHTLGIKTPKVAAVCAIETVNPKMVATTDASTLSQMNRRKEITGCLLDGPLAFDNAINRASAEHKGIISDVAGDADLLLFPTIEVGNAVYKALSYFGRAKIASVLLGATAPIVLTSRADSAADKYNSILLAAASV